MTGYSWISVLALLSYLFLFLTFATTAKPSKEIRSFMVLLVIMILWAGGSFAMRIQLGSSVNLWHHVSLLGMFLLMSGYYRFVLNFLEEKHVHGSTLWAVFHFALFVLNYFTGIFIPIPKVVETGSSPQFIYEYTWCIYVLLACIMPCMIRMIQVIYRHCKGNSIANQQLQPIIYGLAIMVVGHVAATFPIFHGIPVDIMSGLVNIIFIFYSLYKKRLFKISVLFSKSNYLFISILVSAFTLYRLIPFLSTHFTKAWGFDTVVATILISAIGILIAFIVYKFISLIFNRIFIKAEMIQQKRLAKYQNEINHLLSITDILNNLTETIYEITHIDRIFIFVKQRNGNYRIEYTTNLLDEKNFYLEADHPLLAYFKSHNKNISMQEFNRTTVSRSMWETEKQVLKALNAEHFFPITHNGNVIAILVLPYKKDSSPYNQNDLSFVLNLCDLTSAPLFDANAYEYSIYDTRRDKLTGLINRNFFFEMLDKEFEKYKDTSLSLSIISIDDFKLYNQLFGVTEGDAVLQRIAGLLSSSINETSTAARIGGKEFALILPGYDIHSAKLLTENIALEIGQINTKQSGKGFTHLTVSAGICAAPYMASNAKELFQNVETAVYTVKRSGKNAVQIYSSEIYYQQTPQYKHSSGYNENANTIYALTSAIDAKDHYTFQHSQNVAYYATALAKAAGMEPDLIDIVKESALLHDIGKISIEESILNKPGKLTPDEYEIMKKHVENAINIIRNLPALDYVIPTVLSHHERYDGKGYPRHLAGENIPIMGRVLCLADSFDAMTSARSYKPAYSKEKAIQTLYDEAGKQFDPQLTLIFIELLKNNKIKIQGEKVWEPTNTGS